MAAAPRQYRHTDSTHEVVVVGGGMAGICAAVTAARGGARTALVQDRPVLGGNASTEIRVNLEGANGGVHNRFFVESGLAEDLLLENLWRNPTGSADHWSALLLELVLETENLELYLDTHVHDVSLSSDGSIAAVHGVTLASERSWTFSAPLFVDATGDATIAYLAGAEYLTGEDPQSLFDEPLAPREPTDNKLGGTMQFMCKDVGRPVIFERPSFARKVTAEELRVNRIPNVWTQDPVLGGFWWIEYGGDLDTVTDNEEIKRELLAEVWGVWDFVKNNDEWRERNANLDIEWVAAMPGKRESRRVLGDYVLTEQDVVGAARFEDGVAFGGWGIDNHAPRGFHDVDLPPCTQVQVPALYQIPLRSLYSRDVPNLFLAGRDISASHVGCCSARVMLTCAGIGEAVGAAASLGRRPREVDAREAQHELERVGHYIPYRPLTEGRPPADAAATASSEARLEQRTVTTFLSLRRPRMLSLPLRRPRLDSVTIYVRAPAPTRIQWRVYACDPRETWLPQDELARGETVAHEGWVELGIGVEVDPGYVHLALAADDPAAEVGASESRQLGALSWRCHVDSIDAVAVDRRAEGWSLPQDAEEEWGDSVAFPFSFWRRDGHGWGGPPAPGIAFAVSPEQTYAPASAVLEPWERPTPEGVHAWVGTPQAGRSDNGRFVFDEPQTLELTWREPLPADVVEIYLDSDLDRHLANIWYSHPAGFRAMPTLLADFDVAVRDGSGWRDVASVRGNHKRRVSVPVNAPLDGVRVTALATNGETVPTILDIRVWPR